MRASNHSCFIHFTGQQSIQSESCCDRAVDNNSRWNGGDGDDGGVITILEVHEDHNFYRELKHGYILQSANTCCVVHRFSSTAELQYT